MTQQPPDPAAVRATLDRLTATVAGMTPGEWGDDVSGCCVLADGVGRLVTRLDGGGATEADIAGIAALRNAADALIDVARAAAAWVAACDAWDQEPAGDDARRVHTEMGIACRATRANLALLAAAVPGAGDEGGGE